MTSFWTNFHWKIVFCKKSSHLIHIILWHGIDRIGTQSPLQSSVLLPSGYSKWRSALSKAGCLFPVDSFPGLVCCLRLAQWCNHLPPGGHLWHPVATLPYSWHSRQRVPCRCETIFWPPYILTPGSIYRTIFWPRGQYIVTIFWPPSRYFDPPPNNI